MSLAERAKGDRILILDIERLPGLARIWDQKTNFVPVSQWTRVPALLCFAAKWYSDKTVTEFHAAWDNPEAMVQRSWELYDQADIVVTYNGRAFDNKHLRSEWLLAGMSPPSPWKDVDLYHVNRSSFGFESRSLSHLCHRLGIEGKTAGGYDAITAEKAMEGDTKAQAAMKRYNAQDVRITQLCYDRIRPYLHGHPHNPRSTDAKACNACWSERLEVVGTTMAQQIVYQLLRCEDCGANVQGGRLHRAATTKGVR